MTDNHLKYINLALQGGGSHGAFTWGVLDRLLEEKSIKIEGISGTSAGSMNGVLLATGLIHGGRIGAKEKLKEFWEKVSLSPVNPLTSLFYPWVGLLRNNPFYFLWNDILTRIFSPYELNPFNYDPLKNILEEMIDFECLRSSELLKLYIGATDIETNRIKVFDNHDLCVEALLASACLPTIHQAVQWKKGYYWDGGFMGNPILEPLIYNCNSKDILIVKVNPMNRKGVPRSAQDIQDRLNEITFNSSLMREIRSTVNIQRLNYKLGNHEICAAENPFSKLKLHCILDEMLFSNLSARTKQITEWSFISDLMDKGREAGSKWIQDHLQHVGVKTTMDLSAWETPSTHCLEWHHEKKQY